VTDNIHEIVWMMDASTKKVIEVNLLTKPSLEDRSKAL